MKHTTSVIAAGLLALTTGLAGWAPVAGAVPAASAPKAPASASAPTAPSSAAMDHSSTKQQASLSRRRVEEMQAALNNSGAKLDVDGRMGPKTKTALEQFQAQHKLKPTGHLDRKTAQSLNLPHWS